MAAKILRKLGNSIGREPVQSVGCVSGAHTGDDCDPDEDQKNVMKSAGSFLRAHRVIAIDMSWFNDGLRCLELPFSAERCLYGCYRIPSGCQKTVGYHETTAKKLVERSEMNKPSFLQRCRLGYQIFTVILWWAPIRMPWYRWKCFVMCDNVAVSEPLEF